MDSALNAYGFEVLSELGKGSFGTVFLGRFTQNNGDALVAIKAIERQAPGDELRQEIEVMKALSGTSNNIVSLLNDVQTPTQIVIVMEYSDGGNLSEYLQASGRLGEAAIQHIYAQLADAVKAMRSRSISHLDLKPANILLSRPAPLQQNPSYTALVVKVADFGQSRVLKDGEMATGTRGTPLYMAPEVLLREPYSAKADLWSLGAILNECLTGCVPYNDGPVESLQDIFARHLKNYRETGEDTLPKPRLLKACSPSPLLLDLISGLLQLVAEKRFEFEAFFVHPFLNAPNEELHDVQDHAQQAIATADVANASVLGSHDESIEWRNCGGMSSVFGRGAASDSAENSVPGTVRTDAIVPEEGSLVEHWLNAALKKWTEPRPLGSCHVDGLDAVAGRVAVRQEQ